MTIRLALVSHQPPADPAIGSSDTELERLGELARLGGRGRLTRREGFRLARSLALEDKAPMATRHLPVLAVLALLVSIAPAPAHAKETFVAALVCGADRCAELRGAASNETSTILERRFFRRGGRPVPFYDVVFVWRDDAGTLGASDGALRWAPAVGATRTYGSRGPVWSRTGATLPPS